MSNKSHLGHQAKKRFGQNFLHDQSVIGRIVDAINPSSGENTALGLADSTSCIAE